MNNANSNNNEDFDELVNRRKTHSMNIKKGIYSDDSDEDDSHSIASSKDYNIVNSSILKKGNFKN